MINRATTRLPIAKFPIPPLAPDDVLEAEAKFKAIATKWAMLRGELQDVEEEIKAAVNLDLEETAAAYADGKEPQRTGKHQAAAEEKQAVLEQKDLALRKLVDEAGNDLADAIAANTEEWTEAAELVAGEREDEVSALFDELEGKLSELGIARRSVEWLESFNVGEAHIGRVHQFSGGTVRIDLRPGLHGVIQAVTGLAALRDKVKEQFRQKVVA